MDATRSTPSATVDDRTATPGGPVQPWEETLRDGSTVLIRPMLPRDAMLELELLDACSPEVRRMRFLGAMRPSIELARRLTACDNSGNAGLVAIARGRSKRFIAGECSFTLCAGALAECEILVRDDWQQRGLGVALMRHLIDIARMRGVHALVSIDAAENHVMREFARFLGFERRICDQGAAIAVHTLHL